MSEADAKPAGLSLTSLLPRIGTAMVFGAVVLAGLWFGGVWLAVLFALFAGLSSTEFYALQRREHRLPNELVGVAAATALPLTAWIWGMKGMFVVITLLLAASFVWQVLALRIRTADTAITVFGAGYTGFMLAFVVLIRVMPDGRTLALATVIGIWAADVAAYFVGSLIGRHRLAPRISPKKSWEGFYGGVLATTAVWLAVAYQFPGVLSTPWAVGIGIVAAIVALLGDLFESRLKREAGVKDSGSALPGHGGFLDRLDSLIFAAPIIYWMLQWAAK
jgi:phosphatidate cytidylyltransferase